MKKLFLAIRHRDIAEVKALVSKNPELVNCVSKQPPKKDDGQSPLQVAFKTRNFDIADFLISSGADVNHYDSGSINEWKAPVIHDAIMAVIGSAAWGRDSSEVPSVGRALATLQSMIERGANMKSQNSFGNNCAVRAVSDIDNYCPPPHLTEKRQQYLEDLTPVLTMLINSGVDFDESTATRPPATRLLHTDSIARGVLTRLMSELSGQS